MEITTFIMSNGLFKFTQTSFGLLNSGAHCNRVARDVEEQAGEGCKFYVDDTLASSQTVEEHMQLLRRIFQSYIDHGLLVNLKKIS